MKIYLVGGAVRDRLLGIPVKEKDWVVVGATVEEMIRAGFKTVGKDFPVFLHPVTKEEYALARTERKIGLGYTGFEFNTSPDVSLEQDLLRRDLTINAMAQTPNGEIIDPYHGREDLDKKILRHISPAFTEDPVRILRIARFAARFPFQVAPETVLLMRQMVENGEVNALVAERVWKELERALQEKHPDRFFAVLAECGALSVLFPAITYPSQGITALIKTAEQTSHAWIRFASLCHSLSQSDIQKMCERYRIPNDFRDLALLLQKYLPDYQHVPTLQAEALLNLLMGLDALRREKRFKDFLTAAACCSEQTYTIWLLACYQTIKAVNVTHLEGLKGKEIAEKIKAARLTAIVEWLNSNSFFP